MLLGKWLAGKPDLLVLHEPTQAVDVGARHDIIEAIREAAGDGCGVLISSVDAADLAVLCDRVLVFREGKVVAELTGEMTQDDIIHATFGSPGATARRTPGSQSTEQDTELNGKGWPADGHRPTRQRRRRGGHPGSRRPARRGDAGDDPWR